MYQKINTKKDLKFFLDSDKAALNENKKRPKLLGDKIWKFQILLRRTEYWSNQKKLFSKLIFFVYQCIFKKRCQQYGVEIPLNVIDKGLRIWHLNKIIINRNAIIGPNCSISAGVTIGQAHNNLPKIGNNVVLTVDSKVLGVEITDHVLIGAGAVVVKPIKKNYTVWAGVPAKFISNNFPKENCFREERVNKMFETYGKRYK